jgi:hypothetical protein
LFATSSSGTDRRIALWALALEALGLAYRIVITGVVVLDGRLGR